MVSLVELKRDRETRKLKRLFKENYRYPTGWCGGAPRKVREDTRRRIASSTTTTTTASTITTSTAIAVSAAAVYRFIFKDTIGSHGKIIVIRRVGVNPLFRQVLQLSVTVSPL